MFLVFAGVGVLSAPIDWIQQFMGRPNSVITKSEYIRRARIIAQRAKQLTVSRWQLLALPNQPQTRTAICAQRFILVTAAHPLAHHPQLNTTQHIDDVLSVAEDVSQLLPCPPSLHQDVIAMLRRQDKDRKWRSNLKRVEKEVVSLEEDEYQLERVYPQVS
jgi:hypothetical protein